MYMWRGNLWLLVEIVFIFKTIDTDDMCSTITFAAEQNKTLYYSPSTTEPMECCCNLSSTYTHMSVSISSNATYFQLVFHNSETLSVLRNEIGLSLSNKFILCATTTSNSTETGAVTLNGTEAFSVKCRPNTSFAIKTTVQVPRASTTEESVQSRTPLVASGNTPTSVDPTTRDITVITSTLSPPSTIHAQNGSTTADVYQNEKPDDNTVIWIIIPSVAGTIVIIIGVVVYCFLRQRRKSKRADHSDIPESESNPTYCGLTGGDNRVYDNIDTPHQDKDYYNVPQNNDYQNS